MIARTRVYEQRRLLSDGLRETSLDLVLMILTRYGTTFDPILRIEGSEHLPEPGDPTFLAGAHVMLSTIFLRYLDDVGHDPLIIAADPAMRICGTTKSVRVLPPSPRLLFEVRRHLQEGHLVGAMIDRGEPERRNQIFNTGDRTLRISSALVRLAIRCQARIVFIAARLGGQSEIVISLDAPTPAMNTDDVLVSFADFLQRTTNEIGGADGTRTRDLRRDRPAF